MGQTRSDNDGCILSILLDVDDETINIVNVYAPSTDLQRRSSLRIWRVSY